MGFRKTIEIGVLFCFITNLTGAILYFLKMDTISSLMSYSMFALLIATYILTPHKGKVNKWLLLAGVVYFGISLFQYNTGELRDFAVNSIKYLIVVVCGFEIMKNVSAKELAVYLFFGAITISLHMLFFRTGYEGGRFGGFYINPNNASFICSTGVALSYGFKKKKLSTILLLFFSLMGLLTLSRTFILTWICLGLISVIVSFKNIRIFLLGFAAVVILISYSEYFDIQNPRIEQMKSILNQEEVAVDEIGKEGRAETWAKFYDDIYERPFFGSGYYTFQGNTDRHKGGVHNTFLMIMGEAGIIALLTFVFFYISLFRKAVQVFKEQPSYLMMVFVVFMYLLVTHNFFTDYFVILILLWIQIQLVKTKEKRIIDIEENLKVS